MKLKLWMFVTVLALAAMARGATNDLTGLLQKGLFEEEANRNLDAAISNYQSLAGAFDRDRQVAATAIFRLGECYRKLGKTNEAVAQYQRIVREFTDQQTLVTLSQQNLAGLGASNSAAKTSESKKPSETLQQSRQLIVEAEAQLAKNETLLNTLEGMNRQRLRSVLPGMVSDAQFDALAAQLDQAQQDLIRLRGDYTTDHPKYKSAEAVIKEINTKIDDRIDGILLGLHAKVDSNKAYLDTLKAQTRTAAVSAQEGAAQSASGERASTTDEEEKEIRRIQAMIQNSPDLINAPSGDPWLTPLCRAASEDQLRVARFLLDARADVNQKSGNMTPLQHAASRGHRAMVELLLANGADVQARNADGRTSLDLAAEHGFISVMNSLLAAKADINAQDNVGNTALTRAVQNGFRPAAQLLLSQGADPNLMTTRVPPNLAQAGYLVGTPLHFAVLRGNEPMVSLLLSNRADTEIRSPSPYDKTALDIAAEKGSIEIARHLLEAGANPNPQGGSPGEDTPLHRAAGNRHLEIVKLLLSKGANPNATSDYGSGRNRTPLMAAIFNDDKEIASVLLENKADPNLRDEGGTTALWYSLQGQQPQMEMASLLLQHGADPNKTVDHGVTPLMFVCETDNALPEQRVSVVRDLISKGAQINAQNNQGNTALHLAVLRKRPELVELLIASKADVNVQNNEGQTPLDLAKETQTASMPGNFLILNSPPRPLVPPSGLGRRPGPLVPQVQTPATETDLAALLRQHGALDELPNFSAIRVNREGLPGPTTVFLRRSNDWNHFSLLELLATQCGLLSTAQSGQWKVITDYAPQIWEGTLRFPDFKKITIYRRTSDHTKQTATEVNVEDILSAGDCSRDVRLDWGDMVEIPEADHPVGEQWEGPADSTVSALTNCVARQVTVKIKGETTVLKLVPALGSPNPNPFHMRSLTRASFMLRSVLDNSKLIRVSSDLSRVKVTRHDPTTKKAVEWTVDCNSPTAADLWLRDGDVIEVPEKP